MSVGVSELGIPAEILGFRYSALVANPSQILFKLSVLPGHAGKLSMLYVRMRLRVTMSKQIHHYSTSQYLRRFFERHVFNLRQKINCLNMAQEPPDRSHLFLPSCFNQDAPLRADIWTTECTKS